MRPILMLMVICAVAASAIAGEPVSYDVDGKPFEGYYVDAGKNAPLVLILHDWDGLTGYEIKRSEMLSELGYSAFAADLFGAGVRPTEIADKRRLTGELYADRERMRTLMNGALAKAAELGANVENAVVAGYCFGGSAVLELARSGVDLKGFVTFHGGLATPEGQDYSATQGEVLVLHGTADTHITMEQFAALAQDLEKNGIMHEMITYGGAPHAFTVFERESYDAEADRKSWKRFVEFLARVLEQ